MNNTEMKTVKSKQGFTLIELIIIMTILGLLFSVAIPRFIDLRRDAEVVVNHGWIGGLRTAIGIQLAGVVLGKTTAPDPRRSLPAWDCTSIESLLQGGSMSRPTSLSMVGTNQWSGYYIETSTTNWTLTYNTSNRTWEIIGP
jgi:prepilin-type N-terminal cleavage/methylation domain-containing protein